MTESRRSRNWASWLNETHMELTGWQGLRQYRRRMPIKHILHVNVEPPDGLVLWLHDGESVQKLAEDITTETKWEFPAE